MVNNNTNNNPFIEKISLTDLVARCESDYNVLAKANLKDPLNVVVENHYASKSSGIQVIFQFDKIGLDPEQNTIYLRRPSICRGVSDKPDIIFSKRDEFSLCLQRGIKLNDLVNLKISPFAQYDKDQVRMETDKEDQYFVIPIFSYMFRTDTPHESLNNIAEILTVTQEGCREYLRKHFKNVYSPPVDISNSLTTPYGEVDDLKKIILYDTSGGGNKHFNSPIHERHLVNSSNIVSGLVKAITTIPK